MSWRALAIVAVLAAPAAGNTLTVGAGKMYPAPCAAFAAAQPGDTVSIDAATYTGDVCAFDVDNLTITGVGGRAKIDATGVTIPNGKAIWVIEGANDIVENIEMMGAAVPDNNGAGIRQEGANLTVHNCYFHDNQDGILTDPSTPPTFSLIMIDNSEFANNGAGDGLSHNMYIGAVDEFVLEGCYSHDARGGHEVKTRARENHILYNRIEDGPAGMGSYQIDFAQGGISYLIGNEIEKGPQSQNHGSYIYDECQGGCGPVQDLYVVNNTFVNDAGAAGTFVDVETPSPVLVRNNIFVGTGTITNATGATEDHDFTMDPMLVDRTGYDYHLLPGSPCIDAGTAPGTSSEGFILAPTTEYVADLAEAPRQMVGPIDIGAHEYGTAQTPPDDLFDDDGGPGATAKHGGGCCDASGGPGSGVLAALVALVGARRRYRRCSAR
ncbi:MAG TPA: right-handed parallel beta-helix repeat-containing protein [Kofleriaceae bacterium]|nr:right-handed parallel beta-helix repeat-containing protein [Kofleriaceae bacterium]